MILIADSGSTKTHWRLIHSNGKEEDFLSVGLNPYHHSEENFPRVLSSSIAGFFDMDKVTQVYFYGSGCALEAMNLRVSQALSSLFTKADISVFSDVIGAARALFGNENGLVLILGTGSSVAYYDGQNVISRTPSLGYLLGDEGSATHICKDLLIKWLYGDLSLDLISSLKQFCPYPVGEILGKVYSQTSPVKFLTSFMQFIAENINQPEISGIVESSFSDLTRRHLVKYPEFPNSRVGVVGSVGAMFKSQLESVLNRFGGQLNCVEQYPIGGLAAFHRRNPL